jgi:hypothetical protein
MNESQLSRIVKFAFTAIIAGVASCTRPRTGSRATEGNTPELSGILRSGYGGPEAVLAGYRVGIAVGDSAYRCKPVASVVTTDSGGRFHFPPIRQPTSNVSTKDSQRPQWLLCVGLAPAESPWFPMPITGGIHAKSQLKVSCAAHGESGSPECVAAPAS